MCVCVCVCVCINFISYLPTFWWIKQYYQGEKNLNNLFEISNKLTNKT